MNAFSTLQKFVKVKMKKTEETLECCSDPATTIAPIHEHFHYLILMTLVCSQTPTWLFEVYTYCTK